MPLASIISFFLLINCISGLGVELTQVDIFKLSNSPKHSNCYEPRSININSCSNITYPASRTTCKCSINNKKMINLVCDYDEYGKAVWSRQGEFTCVDDESRRDIYNVYWESYGDANGLCHIPRVDLDFIHSCRRGGYPSKYTSCHCANNYERTTTMSCHLTGWPGWKHYQQSWDEQCRDKTNKKDTTMVHLNFYRHDSNGRCNRPEEFLNIFHSCDNIKYPTDKTSCKCTYNPDAKMTLICNNNIWRKYGPEQPCEYNFLPNIVRCYREQYSTEITCSCINNSVKLDMKSKLTYAQIYNICGGMYTSVEGNNTTDGDTIIGTKIAAASSTTTAITTTTTAGSTTTTTRSTITEGTTTTECSTSTKNLKNTLMHFKISTFTLALLLGLILILQIIYCVYKNWKIRNNVAPSKDLSVQYDDVNVLESTSQQRDSHLYEYIQLPVINSTDNTIKSLSIKSGERNSASYEYIDMPEVQLEPTTSTASYYKF